MDDGSKQGNGLHISVYAYSNENVDRLMFTLQDKFNLKCSSGCPQFNIENIKLGARDPQDPSIHP